MALNPSLSHAAAVEVPARIYLHMLCVNNWNPLSGQRIVYKIRLRPGVFTSFLFNTVPFLSINRLFGKQEVTDGHKKNMRK